MGKVDVRVKCSGQTATLPLVIVRGKGQALLGRVWMSVIRIDWAKIHYMFSVKAWALFKDFKLGLK